MLHVLPPQSEHLSPTGRRLRACRLARGADLHELALRAGVDASRLGLAEQGRVALTSCELHSLTTVLHLPLDFLAEDRDLTALRRLDRL